MFACTPLTGGADGSGGTAQFGIGSIVSLIGNVVSIVINYVLDWFIPYTPPEPEECEGPVINDGEGETCEDVNIACSTGFDEMCGRIDDLPEASDGFKQCMKGRCGCGGSNHRRMRIDCADDHDCGACGVPPPDEAYWGCNLGGSQLWYCAPPGATDCECEWAISHEMSHGCGALDLANGGRADAYRIGDWFQQECMLSQAPVPRSANTSGD